MTQHLALLCVLYMICFVFLADGAHNARLWDKCLLTREEVDLLLKIRDACDDSTGPEDDQPGP